MGRGTIYPFVEHFLRGVIKPGMVVVETGCGAAQYRPVITQLGARYIGTDLPNDHYQDPGDVDLHCSADHLPFSSASLDIVFNQGAIDYMPGLDETLAEAHRVLKAGGRLIIFTYRQDVLENIHANCLNSNRPWERTHHVFSIDELCASLRLAGFKAREAIEAVTPPPSSLRQALALRWSARRRIEYLANTIWRCVIATKPR